MPTDTHSHSVPLDGVDQLTLLGINDQNLKLIESLSGTNMVVRADELRIRGPAAAVERVAVLAQHLIERVQTGAGFDTSDIRRSYDELQSGSDGAAPSLETASRAIRGTQKIIAPKSRGQDRYLNAIAENDIVVAIGPAGTGKTYLAVAMAIDSLHKKTVRRIVLARPAVEAGETLGFLPGDLQEKVDPYLRPLYDALEDMLPADRVRRLLETRVIEIAPLAYMRGRTLADAFVILDEAQNATLNQMKMFLTRLGLNSRAVITGDKTQIDLLSRDESGLLHIERILQDIEGIAFAYLSAHDVVRHALVKKILAAYEGAETETAGGRKGSRGRSR